MSKINPFVDWSGQKVNYKPGTPSYPLQGQLDIGKYPGGITTVSGGAQVTHTINDTVSLNTNVSTSRVTGQGFNKGYNQFGFGVNYKF